MWLLNPWVYLGIILSALRSFTITGIWHLPKCDHFVCFKRRNICFSLCICFHNIPTHSSIFLLYNICGTSYFSKGVGCWSHSTQMMSGVLRLTPNSKYACSFCTLTTKWMEHSRDRVWTVLRNLVRSMDDRYMPPSLKTGSALGNSILGNEVCLLAFWNWPDYCPRMCLWNGTVVEVHCSLYRRFPPAKRPHWASPPDLGWTSYPKPPGSLYERCLLHRNNLVTSRLLRTKSRVWKQPSCLAWTHKHILAFLGDDKLLSNNPNGSGTARGVNSWRASRVVTSWFCISSTSVVSITDAQWKQARREENHHGCQVSWHQRSNLKHSADFLNTWVVCLCCLLMKRKKSMLKGTHSQSLADLTHDKSQWKPGLLYL